MACVFDKCCGCIDLKTGCLIIGYLELIGEIIGVIYLIIAFGIGGILLAQEGENEKVGGIVIIVAAGILLFLLIVWLTFTITLLVGLHKDRRGHIKAYLVFTGIFFVIGVISFFGCFAIKPIPVGKLFGFLFNLLINLYFLLVIRSQYVKLGDTSKGPAVYHTA